MPQNSKLKATLLVKHATILTMDPGRTVIEDGALAIAGSEITAIGTTTALENQYNGTQVIDASGCIIIPGLINAHTHLPMSYFKGLADDLPLVKWLQGYIWPLEGKLLRADFVYHASLHGAAEMIKNGITLINDMYFYPEETAKAISQAGLRGILGEALVDFQLEQNGGLAVVGNRAVELTQTFANDPLLDFALAPHSIYACAQPTLEKVVEQALEHDLRVHTHLAETQQEVMDCHNLHDTRLVYYLDQVGLLKTKLIIAHGIWVSEEEMDRLAEHNTAVAICTESNLKLANGFAPVCAYLERKVRLCFGTDGVASNNNLDLLSELDFTAKVHKTLNHDPTVLPAERMLALATIEAAAALHKEAELGSLEIGKKADFVILDCNRIEAQPLYNLYSQVIYALGGRAVRDVVINGQIVLKDGKLTRLDEAELLDSSHRYQQLVLEGLKA